MLQFAKNQLKKVWIGYMRRRDRARRAALGLPDGKLPPSMWDAEVNAAGHLAIGGADTVDLAEEFGTPLYVVDRARLEKNYRSFLGAFQRYYDHVEVDYSYKTNPVPGVLRVLHEAGAGAEVISPFELWMALELGVPPDRITFNGPAKTDWGLERAVEKGIRLINVDNLEEAAKIDSLAERHGKVQKVGVRITTSVGWSSQFGLGIGSGQAREAFESAARHRNLDVCALHLHVGTGIHDPEMYRQAIGEALDFAAEIQRELGIRFRYLDFGGGFGVPTVRKYSSADFRLIANGYPPTVVDASAAPGIDVYAGIIGELLDKSEVVRQEEPPTVLFEPGRAITSSAQSLLLRVLAVKQGDRGGYNAIMDGGLNVAQPTSFQMHEALAASRMTEPPTQSVNLCGPLCHPYDVLGWRKRMPALTEGDIVAIMDSGAYFISNQMNFSNPKAAIALVDNGKASMLRARESFADVVRLDEAIAAPPEISPSMYPSLSSGSGM